MFFVFIFYDVFFTFLFPIDHWNSSNIVEEGIKNFLMNKQLSTFFSPCIKLYKTKLNRLTPDLVIDFPIWRQFVNEAGLKNIHVKESDYDKVLRVAGKYGYSLEILDK